jgi:uncharacterized protein YebE (UPF0316 family)
MKPLMIMCMVLVEVALWQWRVAVTGRGQFLRGALLGGIGAVIQITVVVRLVGELGSSASIAGYAVGVAFGVAAGGFLDRRATPQMVKVQVITPRRHGLPEALRVRGWPTTRFVAHSHDEELDVVNIAIEERRLPELEEAVDGLVPDAGWIIERIVSGRGLAIPIAA